MAVSEFRKHKLNYVFDTFFDVSKDGSIGEDDFEMVIENIAKLKGLGVKGSIYKEIRAGFLKVWEGLKAEGDTDNDGTVSREEWCAIWADKSASDKGWKKLYMELMFKIQDEDEDGCIEVDEFVRVTRIFGVPKPEAVKAFDKISFNKTKAVDLSYYSRLWNEYFNSDNDTAGNGLFGKSTFP